ncbi:MAG: hypothetical protein M1828_003242 [Chrysothrix sp. TS-e1954]|nr:MAG: hypothetical protein M1828_003242 [Chrysothrix sp. TS-e1954]
MSRPVKAAEPSLHKGVFDAWNSSSTGHQRAENRLSGSISWRDSRTIKLAQQLRDGQRGGDRLTDTVGAGSEGSGVNGRKENGGWEKGASGSRAKGQKSLWECVDGGLKVGKSGAGTAEDRTVKRNLAEIYASSKLPDRPDNGLYSQAPPSAQPSSVTCRVDPAQPRSPPIFQNLCFYINGSTYPTISDHKLKHLLVLHGGHLSLALAKRSVTHVILGVNNRNGGTGGGLAGGKLEKEMSSVRGRKVRSVTAEWVVESVKHGRRVPEGSYEGVGVRREGQRSVRVLGERVKTDDKSEATKR